jgi:hypothetical protein
MAKRCAAALGTVLAFGVTAAYSAEKNRDLHIVIDTIQHSQQRSLLSAIGRSTRLAICTSLSRG